MKAGEGGAKRERERGENARAIFPLLPIPPSFDSLFLTLFCLFLRSFVRVCEKKEREAERMQVERDRAEQISRWMRTLDAERAEGGSGGSSV